MLAGEPCGKRGIELLCICNSYMCLRQPAFHCCCHQESSSAQWCCCICTLVILFFLYASDSISTLWPHFSCIPMRTAIDCIPEHYRQKQNSNSTLHDYLPHFLLSNKHQKDLCKKVWLKLVSTIYVAMVIQTLWQLWSLGPYSWKPSNHNIEYGLLCVVGNLLSIILLQRVHFIRM